MKEEKNDKIKDKEKLDKSYINFNKLIDKSLTNKFQYLDDWLLKKSNMLLKETNGIKNSRVYKRGTIIKADFGVGIGSEMSQIHFAIVISKYDNPKNDTLTVIPLSSKTKKHNLNLETLVIDKLIEELDKIMDTVDKDDKVATIKLSNLVRYYKKEVNLTFACINQITTISKSRILFPFNEYDKIGKIKCDIDILEKIDEKVIELLTK
nr:MAG TPA: PemK-like protein [Caudoviricetes sp.]